MIPWYAVSNDLSRNGDAKHYTWGANPPHGTYKELVVDHDSEFISAVAYDSCGPPEHHRICSIYIQKWNSTTKLAEMLECGYGQQSGESEAVLDSYSTLYFVLTLLDHTETVYTYSDP